MLRKLIKKLKRFKSNVEKSYLKNRFKNELNKYLNISSKLFIFEMKINIVKIVRIIMYVYISQKNERININVII